MKRLLMILFALTASLPFAVSAAQSTTSFRVGITIEHDCTVGRTPDGSTVSVACDAPVSTLTRTLAAGQAWPRATRLDPGASMLREVSESDQMRLVIVEY